MTIIQKKVWIKEKEQEIFRSYAQFGNMVKRWDAPKWLCIIKDLEREIRRLKTQLYKSQANPRYHQE